MREESLSSGSGSNRSAKSAGGRYTVLTSAESKSELDRAAYTTNSTISDVVNWCVEHSLERYVRTHRVREIRLRPGKRLRLPR